MGWFCPEGQEPIRTTSFRDLSVSSTTAMKFTLALSFLLSAVASTEAFCPAPAFGLQRTTTTTRSKVVVQAEIRGPTDKAKELKFGWDGTTALGGAVEVAKPARMLEDIRAAGETVPSDCEVFNANLEMSGDDVTFEEVIDIIDKYYEYGLIEFKNGDIVNAQGENEGSAKILSYAALSEMDKETTLKLWGQYYREVRDDPDGDSHPNIRNFMKYGWEGVPFENGIALTRKNVGDGEWDEFAESWIP